MRSSSRRLERARASGPPASMATGRSRLSRTSRAPGSAAHRRPSELLAATTVANAWARALGSPPSRRRSAVGRAFLHHPAKGDGDGVGRGGPLGHAGQRLGQDTAHGRSMPARSPAGTPGAHR